MDRLQEIIFEVVTNSGEPLSTKEVTKQVRKKRKKATRVKILYRLNNLRGEGKLRGKHVGPGNGVWIWWVGTCE